MHHFLVTGHADENGLIYVTGEEVKHMNVLRLKNGEKLSVSDQSGRSYHCELVNLNKEEAVLRIEGTGKTAELPVKLTLYQGLPKGDKMDLIIQKAVELGVCRIVPVEMSRCVVKLDDKKKRSRVERWNAISKSAAEQSGRGFAPEVSEVTPFAEALKEARRGHIVVPYEAEDGMRGVKELLRTVSNEKTVGIFIGPEGGFDQREIECCRQEGGEIISLGKRVLRTETAGLVIIAALMIAIEIGTEE